MDFTATLQVLIRRWYVVIVMLALAAGATFAAGMQVAPQYRATGSVILVPASQATGDAKPASGTNPWSGALGTTASAISRVVTSPVVAQEVALRGGTASYQVGTGVTASPIVDVIATGATPTEAIRTVEEVTAALRDELSRREDEAGAPKETWITVQDLTLPTHASQLLGSRTRVMLAVGALGLVATIGMAMLVDALAKGRRGRKSGRRAVEAVPVSFDAATSDVAAIVSTIGSMSERQEAHR
jgi:uncharacterized protein involved in exopolysaccharide biosynthesis